MKVSKTIIDGVKYIDFGDFAIDQKYADWVYQIMKKKYISNFSPKSKVERDRLAEGFNKFCDDCGGVLQAVGSRGLFALVDQYFPRIRRRVMIGNHTNEQWLAVLKEYSNCCAYCGDDKVKLEKDHVIPVSKGGTNEIDNIVPACAPCNKRKSNKTLQSYKLTKLTGAKWKTTKR